MAKGFDTLRVKSAVKSRSKINLDFTHLTTMDFGQIVPLMAREMVPSDDFSVSADYFSRMAPLARPTYGKFQFKTMTSFVPYHQIADDADAWITGKTLWEGFATKHRYFTVGDLLIFFRNNSFESPGNPDYVSFDVETSQQEARNFTSAGRFYYKVLTALGYSLPENPSLSVYYKKFSAYPLLAFFKAYNDYMSQSQRYNTSQLSYFLRAVKHSQSVDGFDASSGELLGRGIQYLFDNLLLNYENDYFTSAWRFPNSALEFDSVGSIDIPSNDYDIEISRGATDTSLVPRDGDYLDGLGQRALDFLQSFDNWVRRNSYSGSRAVQQVYSRFGIKPDDYRSNYADVIDTDSMPIQVGDVTSVADTSGAALGEYAGKGIMSGGKSFRYRANDYGMLFVFGYFTVTPMNAFGYDRQVLRTEPLDYYTPEFDGLGAEAISVGEFYIDPSVDSSDDSSDNDVFGFTERYNSYRFSRDVITGDFRVPSMRTDMDVWHTGRLLSDVRKVGELVAQSASVNTFPQTDSEYNRIFSVTSDDVDHFYMTARFKVEAIRPMLSLNEAVRLGSGDTVVPRNGNVIS